jgi:transaldolase
MTRLFFIVGATTNPSLMEGTITSISEKNECSVRGVDGKTRSHIYPKRVLRIESLLKAIE